MFNIISNLLVKTARTAQTEDARFWQRVYTGSGASSGASSVDVWNLLVMRKAGHEKVKPLPRHHLPRKAR